MLTREMMRNAGSKAFFELKKTKLCESKTEGSLTTLSLFGDAYKFFFDKERKIAWTKSNHHYKDSSNFKLSTSHKEWQGRFSFPREIVYNTMCPILKEEGIEVVGEDHKKLGIECKIVAHQVYKADKFGLARIFGSVLWKHYDHEIASLAMKIHGLGASAVDYSLIANNKEEVLDTLQKAPGILPIWKDIVFKEMYRNRKNSSRPRPSITAEDFLKKEILDAFDIEFQPVEKMESITSFNYPEEARTFVFPDIIKTVKTHLTPLGLTPAGWRYLIKLPPRMVQTILVHVNGFDTSLVSLFNWLAAIGVVPRQSLLKPFLRNAAFNNDKTEDLTAVLRAGFAHAKKMRCGVRTFFNDQVHLVLDWFYNAGEVHTMPAHASQMHRGYVQMADTFLNPRHECRHVQLDDQQKKASWKWFMRQQEAWHRDATAREAAKLKEKYDKEVWQSEIPEFISKGKYKVIPLTNTYSLIEEGKDMHHCVGSYSQGCMEGYSRIFSIRNLDNSRVATLELRNRSIIMNLAETKQRWEVNQCRGICNDNVSSEIKAVAQEVARKYNKACAKQVQEKMAV